MSGSRRTNTMSILVADRGDGPEGFQRTVPPSRMSYTRGSLGRKRGLSCRLPEVVLLTPVSPGPAGRKVEKTDPDVTNARRDSLWT